MRLKILASDDFKVGETAWHVGGVFSFPKARSWLGFGAVSLPQSQLNEVYLVTSLRTPDVVGASSLGMLAGLVADSAFAGLFGAAVGLSYLKKSIRIAYISFDGGQWAIVQLTEADFDKLNAYAKITGQIDGG